MLQYSFCVMYQSRYIPNNILHDGVRSTDTRTRSSNWAYIGACAQRVILQDAKINDANNTHWPTAFLISWSTAAVISDPIGGNSSCGTIHQTYHSLDTDDCKQSLDYLLLFWFWDWRYGPLCRISIIVAESWSPHAFWYMTHDNKNGFAIGPGMKICLVGDWR